jgi:hypothetical protein
VLAIHGDPGNRHGVSARRAGRAGHSLAPDR